MLLKRFQTFKTRRDGNVLLSFALSASALAAVSAGVLEVSNSYRLKTQTQAALDTAVLAATHVAGTGDVQAVGEQRFLQSLKLRELNIESPEATFIYDPSRNVVDGAASYRVDSLVGALFGLGDKNMSVVAAAEPRILKRIDIAMVLDMSGSMENEMGGGDTRTRLEVLKTSVNNLLDTALGYEGEGEVFVSIVPFAATVNITPFHQDGQPSWFMSIPSTIGYWAARSLGWGDSYAWADDHQVYAEERYASKNGVNITLTLDNPDQHPVEVYGGWERTFRYGWWTYIGHSSSVVSRTPPLPLSNERAEVQTFIDNLESYGGTAGHLGMEWGLYALTPAWQAFWGLDAPAAPFSSEESEKILIMLTDGENSVTQRPEFGRTWYALGDGTANGHDGTWWSNRYFHDVCDLAIAQDVQVFTIALAFGGGQGQPATDAQGNDYIRYPSNTPLGVLQECPDHPSDFFLANDASQLQNAFVKILAQIGELRLTR